MATEETVYQLATYRCNDLEFQVHIMKTRANWGRTDYLITPVSGNGEKWVQADSLVIQE